MKQILALIRQNPFFSAVSVIGTAVSITFVMVIYMVYDLSLIHIPSPRDS